MKKSLVTIIMPVYQVEKYIVRSLHSVLDQTYPSIELILVDDGCTDLSIEYAKEALEQSNISWTIIHQNNSGVGCARNRGLMEASGTWICFLDSDDILVPEAIDHMVCVAEQEHADLVFSDYIELSEGAQISPNISEKQSICIAPNKLQESFLLRSLVVLAPGTLFSRELLASYNLKFSNIKWSEDQHFIWRVLYYAKKSVYLPEPLYQYIIHRNSIMTSTSFAKISSSYSDICTLVKDYYQSGKIHQFLVPRWVMGTLNSATRISSFREWSSLWRDLDGSYQMRKLLSFPKFSVRILALIGCITKYGYYWFNRRR